MQGIQGDRRPIGPQQGHLGLPLGWREVFHIGGFLQLGHELAIFLVAAPLLVELLQGIVQVLDEGLQVLGLDGLFPRVAYTKASRSNKIKQIKQSEAVELRWVSTMTPHFGPPAPSSGFKGSSEPSSPKPKPETRAT